MKIDPASIPEVAMPFMQETHLEEVAMLNELYELFERAGAGEDVYELPWKIETLSAHTHAHFAREEERMAELGFPPYPVHRQAHDDYLNAFDAVLDAWRASGDVGPVARFLTETTPGWLQQHIATMDFVTAGFFAAHGPDSGGG